MPDSTVTRADIVEALYKEIGLSKTESGDLLESMIDHIVSRLTLGETVKLAGFGVFSTRQKSERPGRNPKTGDAATIAARRVVVFSPSKKFKERVNFSAQT